MRNIVFDLGNVLVRFRPEQDLAGYYSEDDVAFLLDAVFRTPEWIELDRGTLTDEEATAAFAARHPGQAALIRECMAARHRLLTPIAGSVALLAPLKRRGYGLYYLSNYHASLFEIAERDFAFLELFDGGVISSHVRRLKPEPAIYGMLLERCGIRAEESLFIDDTPANVDGARAAGLQTLLLEDPGQLEAALTEQGIL